MNTKNLILPGNPRYQPEILKPYFGYDNLHKWYTKIELAALDVLIDISVIKKEEAVLLTQEIREACLNITTSQVDTEERMVTKHDIGALRNEIKKVLPKELHRFVHIPMTSYDVVDTARPLMFKTTHNEVVIPKMKELITILSDMALKYSDTPQIGRTHGQHGVPITVGFWLATILSRINNSFIQSNDAASKLCGKVSGPVGAYNAQYSSGINTLCGEKTFEERVLEKVGLKASPISTQISQPEPMANYLYSMVLLSGALAQFGEDCRQLMRTEIGEIAESFEVGQVGSSTMAHKRNPINFENICGTFIKNQAEFSKVTGTLISEHQRDLTGSPVARDYPIIVINTMLQIETLLRKDKNGLTFLERIVIDEEACKRNLSGMGNLILAEPFYIALQMAGYNGDAHELVNHTVVPMIKNTDKTLLDAATEIAKTDDHLKSVLEKLPKEIIETLKNPSSYIGLSREKTIEIVNTVKENI